MGNSITLLSRFTPYSRFWRRLRVPEAMDILNRPPRKVFVMDPTENSTPDEFEKYDVFISHRGPDTKTGFVGFLYKDLKRAGLQPFLDCRSIGIGEDAWKCIEDAIKKTPIAIVIFSENFAQSEWCMRELHLILDTPGIKVLPIFYNIQTWEVKFPDSERGKLKRGFQKLKQRHDKTIIEQWRADLEIASKLMGWEHPDADKRLEGDLVTEVVGKAFELANKPLPLNVGDYVVGVKQVAERIIQTLDNKNILLLGLWGMGGIGKSTLARELYNRLGKSFASSCYVEDVTEKVVQGGVEKVQNRILQDLCMTESVHIEDKSKGKAILEERLCKKRVLVVLDDVRDEDEMDYWITRKMVMEGSMCIVTSRNRRVFEKSNSFDVNHEIHIHDVQLLSEDDSKQVFTSFTFGRNCKIRPGFERLVDKISVACGGVPLVLKVCGALLKEEKNMDMWNEVLEKLNRGAIMDEKKIFDCLRISYDALPQQQQEMFLDIACCLLGEAEDSAKRVWRSQGWFAALGIRNLVEKALITLDNRGRFTMHDHLRDMGCEIERMRSESEGVCRRLQMPESLTLLEENEPWPDTLQNLIIWNHDDPDHDLELSHLKELRLMKCDDIRVTSVPANLRWLHCWELLEDEHLRENGLFFPVGNTYSVKSQNSKLVVLDMERSYIDSLPEATGKLRNLEMIIMRGCSKLNTLPESFWCLKKLKNLNLEDSGIESLPDAFGELGNLEVLELSRCHELTTLPGSIGGLKQLKYLHLAGSGIQSLPESFGEMSNLEVLDLSTCNKLNMLPESIGGLSQLKILYLALSVIELLPKSFGELSNLEVLDLRCSYQLRMVPESFGGLKQLRYLDLTGSATQSLPESFGELSNLLVLDLSRCNQLNMLPESVEGLKQLKYLELTGCGIQSLPESFGELSNLELLDLSPCYQFNMLPESIGGLRQLKHLHLGGSGIHSLPESFGKMSNLEVLNLADCNQLNMLPESIGGLKQLRNLDLSGCVIQSLPESFGVLSNLEVLNLSMWLSMLPESIGGLKQVKNLDLAGCVIQHLPESFGELSNLEVLNLSWCVQLNTLPGSIGGLKQLKYLYLEGSGIQSLPESVGELSNLGVLDLTDCNELNMLPESMVGLKQLKNLHLRGSGICLLPESFEELRNLGMLTGLTLEGMTGEPYAAVTVGVTKSRHSICALTRI